MLGSNDKTPLAAIAPGADSISLGGIKTSCEASPTASSFAAACSATTNCDEKPWRKYTLDISKLMEGSTTPQIWPHLAVLVLFSLLRYAAPAIQSNPFPAKPKRNSGTGFLAAEMKEYDA